MTLHNICQKITSQNSKKLGIERWFLSRSDSTRNSPSPTTTATTSPSTAIKSTTANTAKLFSNGKSIPLANAAPVESPAWLGAKKGGWSSLPESDATNEISRESGASAVERSR